ncbi:hypothetical protein [Nonomuraea sp. NPDC049400]|uniref:hypothetical protein n=1 Tax=Nonomuraea sp. NPDC049400 TaxID=3364352 RepID=UPI0037B75A78
MTTTSRAPTVIDALVALFDAAPALDGVKVIDGPIVTNDPLHKAVFVGYDGDPENDGGEAVTFSQDWASIGQKAKDETFTVQCAVAAWKGSTKVKPVRDLAYSLLAAVENTLRADPSLGQPPPTIVAFASGALIQAQRQSGIECRIPFQIAVRTRI